MSIENIAAVVVSYNPDQSLFNSIKSLSKQLKKIVIVDNGSNKQSIENLNEIDKAYECVELILKSDNTGIAHALNVGIKHIEKDFDWILTMDQDSVPADNMIEIMVSTWNQIREDERIKVKSIFPNFIDAKVMCIDEFDSLEPYVYVDAEITSGNLIKTEVFSEIGYFDESLFIDLVDTDYCMRLYERNIKMIKVTKAQLSHSLGNACRIENKVIKFNTTNHSPIRRYYMTRNRLYTWKKYKHLDSFTLKRDKNLFFKELIKIILGENQKMKKLNMIFKGYIHYKKGIRGKLNIKEG